PQAGNATNALEISPALNEMVATLRPAMVLVLGHVAARAALGRTEPLAGEAGRLLDNMLRAMQLHRHPRVFLAALERPQAGNATDALEIAPALNEMVAILRPTMVLVLGHVAARAALGRTEPLGRLRAELHQLAGCPAIVTYDPAFLLRSQGYKGAAWADLCRALSLAHAATARP
ncbi:uracil-DNA glycosylase family protein, partial [Acidovorax sp. 24-64-9]|uniref:uracil-DNA glycosylase family protein n=1 Tax=Acidovorax sp. 24-64-9 TaxID=1970309 RepID=UPI0025C2B66C